MVRVESDMRAHMNPTSMIVISQLAEKLDQRLSILCPKCKLPGLSQDDIDITLVEGVLTISGEKNLNQQQKIKLTTLQNGNMDPFQGL